MIREERRAGGDAGLRQQEAGQTAGDRQDQRFDDQVLEDAPASGAERRADRDFLPAAERAREDQVAGVRAGDEQHERDGRQEYHERAARIADDQLLQGDRGRAPAGVLRRELLREARRDHVELGLGLFEGNARLQPRNDLVVVVLADRGLLVVPRERGPDRQRRHEPRFEGEARRHHADDRVSVAVEVERPASTICGSPAPVSVSARPK